jgi:hypothetical protein
MYIRITELHLGLLSRRGEEGEEGGGAKWLFPVQHATFRS